MIGPQPIGRGEARRERRTFWLTQHLLRCTRWQVARRLNRDRARKPRRCRSQPPWRLRSAAHPGTLINCRHLASDRLRTSISPVTVSIRSSRQHPSSSRPRISLAVRGEISSFRLSSIANSDLRRACGPALTAMPCSIHGDDARRQLLEGIFETQSPDPHAEGNFPIRGQNTSLSDVDADHHR